MLAKTSQEAGEQGERGKRGSVTLRYSGSKVPPETTCCTRSLDIQTVVADITLAKIINSASAIMDTKTYHGREQSANEPTAPLLASAYLVSSNPTSSPPPIGTTGIMSTRMGSRTVIKVSFVAGKIEEGLPSFEKSGLVGTNVDREEYYAMCMAVYPTKGYNQLRDKENGTSTATRPTASGPTATGDGTDDPAAMRGVLAISFVVFSTIVIFIIFYLDQTDDDTDDRRLYTDDDTSSRGFLVIIPILSILARNRRAKAAKANRAEMMHAIERKTNGMDGQAWEIHEQVEGGCCGERKGAYANVTCYRMTGV